MDLGKRQFYCGAACWPPRSPLHPHCTVQALTLRRISVYFDTDAEFWVPQPAAAAAGAPGGAAAWRALPPHEWDEWFLPGISLVRQERGGTARGRQYVLRPVDGRARYTRRGAGVQAKGARRRQRGRASGLGAEAAGWQAHLQQERRVLWALWASPALLLLHSPAGVSCRLSCPPRPHASRCTEGEPQVEVDFGLDEVAVRLSRE